MSLELLGLLACLAALYYVVLGRARDHVESENALFLVRRDFLRAATEDVVVLCRDYGELPDFTPHATYGLSDNGLSDVRHAAGEMARGRGLPARRESEFVVAVGEAIMNAVRYGQSPYALLGYDEDAVYAFVSDQGPGIPNATLPFAVLRRGWSSSRTAGMGFCLMIEQMDSLYLLTGSGGTVVVLKCCREASDPLDGFLEGFRVD